MTTPEAPAATDELAAAADIDPSSVLVGVDGSDDADRAILWAAEHAYAERRPLAIVTAIGAPQVTGVTWSGLGTAYAEHPQELTEAGREICQEAAAVARHLHPGLDVATLVLVGDPRQVLVDLSRRLHLVVLGSRGRGVFRSKLLGSVSAAVSRDAACPVVVCRPVDADRPGLGVLVGADGTRESLPVIEFAFQQASVMDLPLTVTRCVWDDNRPTHEPEVVPADAPGFEQDRLLLAESVAGMAEKFPEVTVELRLEHGIAEECLSHDSPAWDLVVVGRHPVDSLVRLLTGAIATIVLERARTTVAVVPEAYPPDDFIDDFTDDSARADR